MILFTKPTMQYNNYFTWKYCPCYALKITMERFSKVNNDCSCLNILLVEKDPRINWVAFQSCLLHSNQFDILVKHIKSTTGHYLMLNSDKHNYLYVSHIGCLFIFFLSSKYDIAYLDYIHLQKYLVLANSIRRRPFHNSINQLQISNWSIALPVMIILLLFNIR